MQEQISKDSDSKASFLLTFTKELIKSTSAYQNAVIKNKTGGIITKYRTEKKAELKEHRLSQQKQAEFSGTGLTEEIRKEEIKEIVKEKIKSEAKTVSQMEKSALLPDLRQLRMISKPVQRTMQKPMLLRTDLRRPARILPPVLMIPEPALPETVSYLRPQPTTEEISLGKLSTLVKDPLVKIIECNGPDQNIFVLGMMGRRPTSVKLNKEEVNEILKRFSVTSKIPLHEGLFKAAVGNMVISAAISEEVGIKFIIRKIRQRF